MVYNLVVYSKYSPNLQFYYLNKIQNKDEKEHRPSAFYPEVGNVGKDMESNIPLSPLP